MERNNLKPARLMALFSVGWLLFNYPFLTLFNIRRFYAGIPVLYLFIFGAWLVLIVLVALAVRTPGAAANKDPFR